jgi:hypothetical protein
MNTGLGEDENSLTCTLVLPMADLPASGNVTFANTSLYGDGGIPFSVPPNLPPMKWHKMDSSIAASLK